jgi:transcriptional regulator
VYLPQYFEFPARPQIEAFVDAAGAADLITFDGDRPVATLLPVIWDRPVASDSEDELGPDREQGLDSEQGLGRLVGHLALANDQWRTALPGAQALAIVHGPQAYVSPSWYESTSRHGRTVPTWNYEAVHLTGTLTVHRDPQWLREIVTRLTSRHEDSRARPWTLSDAPAPYIDGQLRAIVGVELTITSVEAKQKLGQNRSAADQAGTVAGLRAEPGTGPEAIADLMAARLDPGDGS